MRLAILALTALLAVPTTGSAQMRADELMWKCEAKADNPKGTFDLAYCAGYLGGITDLNAILPATHRPMIFCLPTTEGVSNDQLRLVFLKWAKDHPEQLHETARTSVIGAFYEAFKCGQARVPAPSNSPPGKN